MAKNKESYKDLYPFESHFLEIQGQKIHYIDEGEGPGKPVLLMVHGNPTWSFYWRNLIQYFRKDFRVVALDHVGCGYSDKPQKYSYVLSQHIQNLTSLIEELDLKNITLFVHDWGGAIGMGYATAHPKNVKAFVVFNTAAFPSKNIPLRISACRIPFLGKLLIQGLNGFARAATVMATEKGFSKEIKQGYLAPYNSFANRVGTFEFVQDIPMKTNHPSWSTLADIEAGLSSLSSHPMILIWGGKDWVFDDRILETWKTKFPDAQVQYFPDAGHYVVEDACQEIIPFVDRFLQRVASA